MEMVSLSYSMPIDSELQLALTRSLMPIIWPNVFALDTEKATATMVEEGLERLDNCLHFLSKTYLHAGQYCANQSSLTIADFSLGTALELLNHKSVSFDMSSHAIIKQWLERVRQTKCWAQVHKGLDICHES